jgi:hypothetical protein
MVWNPATQVPLGQYYSPGVSDMPCLDLPNGGIASFYNKEVFNVLSEHSSSSSVAKSPQADRQRRLEGGKAVSVEAGLLTTFMEKSSGWFWGEKEGLTIVEERYLTHWTPQRDEKGRVGRMVLTIAPEI